MLLIYVKKETSRISYIFKHICQRILGVDATFSTVLEEFISYPGAKISYGKKPLGNELFFQSSGLLEQQGIESEEVIVKKWDETVGFFSVSANSALPFDIFSASFYLLARYEEYLPQVKDEKGRFMASESLAYQSGFLHQPVVDIWAYKFKEKLIETFSKLEFHNRKVVIHSVIEASRPYDYKQKGFFRTVVGFGNDLFGGKFRRLPERSKVLLGLKRDPRDTFKWIVNTARHSNFKTTLFFLLGEMPSFTESLNTHRQKFKLLLKYVADYKEVGLIFSYESLSDYEMLKSEKRRLEEITNRSLENSMNAEAMVKLPDMYRNLIELEIKNDYTMAYTDMPGFRAGTCTPFLFYDIDYEIKTPLVVQPIAMMSRAFRQKYTTDIEKAVDNYLREIEKVQGTLVIIFSNEDFASTPENKVWRNIFSERLSKYEA